MVLLSHITTLLVVFLAVAALGAVLVLGVVADFLVRNRAQRLRLRMPVLSCYRHLPIGH